MAKKKVTKRKNSPEDKAIKAKPTGLRFKTKGVKALQKKDGELNKKGEELYFKRPKDVLTKKEIDKFKRKADGSYESDTKQIYNERRKDKKHSDDDLRKQYDNGGGVEKSFMVNYKVGAGETDDIVIKAINKQEARDIANDEYEIMDTQIKSITEIGDDEYDNGGSIKQNKPQSKSYSKKNDKGEKAKPVGKRYTTKLAKKLHKRPNETPTKKDVEEYLGKGVYDEKRKDKSDVSLTKKLEEGGQATIEISCEELKALLGREPKYPRDFANGKKYEKCFLRPYYRLCD